MSWRRVLALAVVLAGLGVVGRPLPAQPPAAADDLNAMHEKVMKDAVRKVAPSVVQILTQGGTDMVAVGPKGLVFRKAMGPTTGVIVSQDGYVISSAFNFINNPTTILVAVPGQEKPFLARRVATDQSRMLTLLKIDKSGLPVPEVVPVKDLKEGQWTLALGRTLDLKRDAPPSVSAGIISALDRVWGKAIQADAKISPINYGGPLVDIEGRVQGILIPASPRGEEQTAGFEWYDSGIGFAVPMEHVMATLPRLKEGKDLKKAVLGIRVKTKDIYGGAPELAEVVAGSAAAKAGLKAGDVIVELDGKPVVRHAQVLHALGPKYEGDKISLKYKRGDKVVAVNDLALVGELVVHTHPYMGILPLRDDPKLGVELRHVFPKSPADAAGLRPGDRIVKYGAGDKAETAFKGQKRGRDELRDFLNGQAPDKEISLEVQRKGGKTETLKVKLAALPGTSKDNEDVIPEKLPAAASAKKALEPLQTSDPNVKPPKIDPPKKPETGLLKRTNAAGDHKYWVYVHEDYNPNVAHALIVWLHPAGKNSEDDMKEFSEIWEEFCKENHAILVMPQSDNETGWILSEADLVKEAVRDAQNRYTIDGQRVVVHGMGVGGQMAIYLGFANRDLFDAVATTGAVVNQAQDNAANQRLAFFLVAGDRDPLAKAIAESKTRLQEKRFPAVYREIAERGREYLNEATLRQLWRWIDLLDRL